MADSSLQHSVSPVPTAADAGLSWSAAEFLRIVYLIFGLIGLIGNGLVLFVFIRVRSLRTITNLFIGNQSLIDLVSSIFILISKFRNEHTDFTKLSRGTGIFVCLFWTSDYIYWGLLVSSTTNLVFITLERYMAVVKPIVYRKRVNWVSATVVAVFPWVFGLIFELFWPAVHRLVDGECYPDWRSPWIQAFVGIVIFVAEHIVPIIVMILVYTGIVKKLRNKVGAEVTGANQNDQQRVVQTVGNPEAQQGSSQQSKQDRAPDLRQRVRSNVIKTLFLVAFVYIICWTPNQVIFLLYNLNLYDLDFNGVVYTLGVSLAFCNMWINPFIYTFKYRKFQEGLKVVFCMGGATQLAMTESTTKATNA